MRREPETKAERATNDWYDSHFIFLRTKLNLHGRRGWPDQCYWLPGGPLLIEFKAIGEEPRKLQAYIHRRLTEDGYEIQEHYEAATAIAAIKHALATRAVPSGRRKVPDRKS